MRIFIGNLNFGTTEDTVRSLFETHGAVDGVSIVTDRETGRSRGFGFVDMSDSAAAGKAISELHGREVGGRALTVNEARPKPERGFGGGWRENGGGSHRGQRW
jgi:cold-inducible RNA-binding protein